MSVEEANDTSSASSSVPAYHGFDSKAQEHVKQLARTLSQQSGIDVNDGKKRSVLRAGIWLTGILFSRICRSLV